MTIADKLTLLANTKEALRTKLKLAKSVPFSKYPDYVNWNTAPSIPSKAFYADFTNDRYVKDGVPCSFKDLFTFTRAGKAWLVKDTGLQEYAADVPRLDSGLLIEQSATNYMTWSVLQGTDAQNYTPLSNIIASDDTILKTGKMYTYTKGATAYAYKSYPRLNLNIDVYASRTDGLAATLGDITANFNGAFASVNRSDIKSNYNRVTGLTIVSGSLIESPTFLGIVKYVSQDLPDADLRSHAMQATEDDYSSSLIVTSTVPVTRPADHLLNKITGTTVTGDWDSTLNLSIVAGKLVHSGYGRIRSLEIN